ncbi:hypothetical protein HanIR_Chr17g0849451 [Helianthus annuus]|nr:hypothetical protein HanIR_Chr17g0849451 [Helianthus annuus]
MRRLRLQNVSNLDKELQNTCYLCKEVILYTQFKNPILVSQKDFYGSVSVYLKIVCNFAYRYYILLKKITPSPPPPISC